MAKRELAEPRAPDAVSDIAANHSLISEPTHVYQTLDGHRHNNGQTTRCVSEADSRKQHLTVDRDAAAQYDKRRAPRSLHCVLAAQRGLAQELGR